jgi:hypothetical protein
MFPYFFSLSSNKIAKLQGRVVTEQQYPQRRKTKREEEGRLGFYIHLVRVALAWVGAVTDVYASTRQL